MLALGVLAVATTVAMLCVGLFVGDQLLQGTVAGSLCTGVAFALGWPFAIGCALAAAAFCFPICVLYVVLVQMPAAVIAAIKGKPKAAS